MRASIYNVLLRIEKVTISHFLIELETKSNKIIICKNNKTSNSMLHSLISLLKPQ